jgi:MFS family permease
MRSRLSAVIASLPRSYWLLWIGTLVNRLGSFVIPFLTLYLTQRRGLPVSQAALMVSLFGAGSFTSALIGGELADRLGRRPVMLLSFLLAPLNMIALGLAQPLALLAALTFTQGLLTDLYRPAVSAAIADLVPSEDRPRAFGYLYWAINLGFAIAPVLAGLMARLDYFLLFVGDAATTFAFGLIVLAGVRETRPAEARAASKAPLRQRIGQLRSSPLMLLFCGLALAFGIIYMQAHVTLPVDMAAHGLGPEQYGLAIAVNGVLIVLLGLPASHAAGRWPRYGAMAVAALLAGAGFGLTGLASSLPLFGLSIGVWTLGEIAASTIAPAIVADLSPVELRGLFQGAYGAAWGLSAFAGPLLGGWVYQHLGATSLWAGCLGLGLLLTLGYFALGRRATRANPGASMVATPPPPATPLP